MEQNTQHSENSAEIKLDSESELINPMSNKQINKKIILLIIVILVIIGFGAVYFLFLNKEDNGKLSSDGDAAVLENKKEVEINKELDSDQDGLPDYVEKVLGTDINNEDTDGDSYSDFEEIKNGYNPLDDKKFTEEEWENVKGRIRDENREFFEVVFIMENMKENDTENDINNGDFSSLEATLKVYILAIETKNLNLYLKTHDKESVNILTQDSAFAGSKNINEWNPMLSKMFKDANYRISEQTAKYAIMAPEFREQISSVSGVTPVKTASMSDIYFQYEDNLWKINFITTLSDLVMRTPAEEIPSAKGDALNLDKKEEEIKQIKEDWRNSFK